MVSDQQVSVLEQPWVEGAPLTDDRTALAMAAGLIAALIGGGIWAAIVLFASLEIGWAAWGVGVLVGGAMARVTINRSQSLGAVAAGLAVAGLLAGKLAITLGSVGAISEELAENPGYLMGAVAWQLYEDGALDPATQQGVDATLEAGDTLSDAIWAEMLNQAEERIAVMSGDERREVARGLAEGYISQMGIANALRVQLGPWDLLWFGLAIVTAFRMMAGQKPAMAPQRS